MRRREFRFHEDLIDNCDGWRPTFGEYFSQGTGWTVAHYALEQLPDGKGDYPFELEALGRMWWLRYESGFETDQAHGERKAHTVPELLGNALFWLTLSTAYENPSFAFGIIEPVNSALLDDALRSTLEQAIQIFKARFGSDPLLAESTYEGKDALVSEQNLVAIASRLRAGFLDGQHLYPDNRATAFKVFQEIARQVDELWDAQLPEPGDRLMVEFDVSAGTVQVTQLADVELVP
jgi:hypothetical protein